MTKKNVFTQSTPNVDMFIATRPIRELEDGFLCRIQ